MSGLRFRSGVAAVVLGSGPLMVLAMVGTAAAQAPAVRPLAGRSGPASLTGARVPGSGTDEYVIGADDVLSVVFWRNTDMSANVVVRPDGRITLPLINDVAAAGLTPDQLRQRLSIEASQFLEDAEATVIVKEIHSRKVFITGAVAKPGPYPLIGPLTVLQLIAVAGGLQEWADAGDILIMRGAGQGATVAAFDYSAVARRRKLEQNVFLRPGDTVVVP